jgi:hypothetical protein
MNVTVKYGKDTHGLVVDEAGTLGQLCNQLEAVTGVPRHLQVRLPHCAVADDQCRKLISRNSQLF